MERKDHHARRNDLQWSERSKIHGYVKEQQQLSHHSHAQFDQIGQPVTRPRCDDFPNYSCGARCDGADSNRYVSERVHASHGNTSWQRTSHRPVRNTDTGNCTPVTLSNWNLGDASCFDHTEPSSDQLLDEELKTLNMEGLSFPCGHLDFTEQMPSLYCSGISGDGCNLQSRETELASSEKPYTLSDGITDHKGVTDKDSLENGCLSSIHQRKSSVCTHGFLEGCFQPGSYGDHSYPFSADDNLSFLDNLDCIRSANASQEDGIDECEEFNEDEGLDENPVKMMEDISYPVKFTSRKSGKRQRNKSTKDTCDKEDAREHVKKNGKTSAANKQRHTKAERKRQHVDNRDRLKSSVQKQTEELLWRCVTYVKILMDVILFVTHKCGEYVETGGKFVYSCCQIQKEDFKCLKGSARTSCMWLLKQAKSGSEKLRWFCFSSMKMTIKFLKMLLALLFLVLMLFIGCLRLCYKYGKSGVSRIFQKLPIWGRESVPHFPAVRFLHSLCSSIAESRTWNYLKRLWEKLKMRSWLTGKWRTAGQSQASSPSPKSPSASRYQPDHEVNRLLAMADIPEEDLDPFKVLGVEVMATDAELKKAYRQLAVLVHPDKNQHPRSEEAFKVVRAAWDIVSNPERRKEYEIKRAAESELHRSMNEFLTKLQDDLKEAMNTMMCSKCEGKHKRFEMDRDPQAARYCAVCNKRHPVEDGDFWAESSMLGLKITYFAMMDGKVYDITEWAGCQRVGINPDIHHVPYHISFATRTSGNSGRHRASSENSPSPPTDLQDFLSKIFQGAAPQKANGSFFGPPQSGPSNQPKTEAAPKTETKQKRRKKVRRTFPR
ncbi:dnaJ homolog subfamily C member 14 [Scyliorhinus canicula]|uniref:dnaJ homolog subfamily C member 14 n=1 Tax=Scyliorhinus canicula TaxID=7830 RepID=UPI0018F3019F|nr:dnaJ homolog subfamily C member 14 [Scyliorhinus canicula]XP_038642349.1 dnaJ homolog subfamily C member 14 [Scyliorhinus canicula]